MVGHAVQSDVDVGNKYCQSQILMEKCVFSVTTTQSPHPTEEVARKQDVHLIKS